MTKKLIDPKASPWQLYHAHTSSGITADDSRTQAYRSKAKPTIAQPRQIPATRIQQHYMGAELAPYTGRPGAMRAYALPSLVAGQLVARKLPICAPTAKQGQ
jgi:hypothetical protein